MNHDTVSVYQLSSRNFDHIHCWKHKKKLQRQLTQIILCFLYGVHWLIAVICKFQCTNKISASVWSNLCTVHWPWQRPLTFIFSLNGKKRITTYKLLKQWHTIGYSSGLIRQLSVGISHLKLHFPFVWLHIWRFNFPPKEHWLEIWLTIVIHRHKSLLP
jgi:hypothetical protein